MKICPRCKLKYQDEDTRCFVDGTALEALPDERIGTLLSGRYLIESQLGEGGMAVVYRARHTLVDRPVAVKIMTPRLAKDPQLRERFRREAKNAAALAHPNIVEIFDTGDTEDGTAFLVMELLEGASLSALIAQQGKLTPDLTIELGLQIGKGLARAHDFQVIHRDLKPDNIFVTRGKDGRKQVKLLDFGIARSMHDSRLTNSGELFGTPQYMAPERVTSIDAGPAADLYAVGIILFEMVTGRVPFEASDLPSMLMAHLQEVPPRPSSLGIEIPHRLEELILSLLAKRPEERPVDAHQVIRELTALLPETGAHTSMAPPDASTAPRAMSVTLPPTTLERWMTRAALFDQMLQKAFGSAPPANLAALLGELRAALSRLTDLRNAGLREQRKLDVIEASARDGNARLGHAVDTLGLDLSHAREAVGKARKWLDAKEREVADLEFQIEALRSQRARLEAAVEEEKHLLETLLRDNGKEHERIEQLLVTAGARFVEPLRGREELVRLFTELEGPAA